LKTKIKLKRPLNLIFLLFAAQLLVIKEWQITEICMEDVEKLLELPELMHTAEQMADYYERSGNPKYLQSGLVLIKGMRQDFEAARETLSSQYGFNISEDSVETLPVDYSVDLEEIDSESDPASQILAAAELYSEFRETREYVARTIDRHDLEKHIETHPETDR
jgi:hypothetical protein